MLYEILNNMIKNIEHRLDNMHITITLTDKAKDYIVDNSYDEKFGARPMKRYVVKHIENLLANEILQDNISFGENITIDVENNELKIKP